MLSSLAALPTTFQQQGINPYPMGTPLSSYGGYAGSMGQNSMVPNQGTGLVPNASQFASMVGGGGGGDMNDYNMGQNVPVLGWVTSAAKDIVTAIQSQRQSPQSKMEEHRWGRTKEPTGQLYNQMFNNPVLGQYAQDVYSHNSVNPYAVTPYGAWTEKEAYNWNPSQATQALYSHYLNRSYGLPESVAQAQAAQSMQPMRMPTLSRNVMQPAQAGAAFSQGGQMDPRAMANAMLGSKMPAAQRNLDYLQNAAALSLYNLKRAQKMPMMIG
jgi:hypothetical protein